MTNTEIIMGAMLLAEIDLDTEVHTFAEWNRRGYQIIKGEHPCFSIKIWKPRPKKKKKDTETEEEEQSRLILVMANFFTEKQVKKRV